jgi:hypothetical protein
MPPPLIIFVDGFPFSILSCVNGWKGFEVQQPLQTGLGYSINIKSEIFGGHRADDLGFFNEWQLRPHYAVQPPGGTLERASLLIERIYYLDRIVHRAYAMLRHQVCNIPFRFVGYFHEAGLSVFSPQFPHPTIMSRYPALKVFSLATYAGRVADGLRDRCVYEDAKRAVREGFPVLAAFEEFDGAGHSYGVGTPEYMDRVHEFVGWVDDLVKTFRSQNGDAGEIFLFSDHGMANVTEEAELDIERTFGRAAPDRYLYFLDATMARVWLFDPTLRESIASYLQSRNFGRLVDDETRQRYGIASRHGGDLLFLLNEGIGLCPTFFGRRTAKALHGYDPTLANQQGVFLYSGPRSEAARMVSAISVIHPLLDDALRHGGSQ